LNIVLNYLFIPVVGYEIAAYTTFIGYLVISVCHYFISRMLIKHDIYEIKYTLLYLMCFMLISSSAIWIYKVHFLFRYAILCILVVFAFYYGLKNKNVLFKKL